jgi:hypothetical protein
MWPYMSTCKRATRRPQMINISSFFGYPRHRKKQRRQGGRERGDRKRERRQGGRERGEREERERDRQRGDRERERRERTPVRQQTNPVNPS